MENTIKQQVMTQPEKSDYIIDKWCEFFGIGKEKLQERLGIRSPIWDKKRYLVLVLDDNTAYSSQEIADKVGYKQRGNVNYHIRTLRDELGEDVYGRDKIKKTYSEFIAYLNL